MRAQLELGNMVKTGQLGQLWEVACQTNLQFNLVRCVWPPGTIGPRHHRWQPQPHTCSSCHRQLLVSWRQLWAALHCSSGCLAECAPFGD